MPEKSRRAPATEALPIEKYKSEYLTNFSTLAIYKTLATGARFNVIETFLCIRILIFSLLKNV